MKQVINSPATRAGSTPGSGAATPGPVLQEEAAVQADLGRLAEVVQPTTPEVFCSDSSTAEVQVMPEGDTRKLANRPFLTETRAVGPARAYVSDLLASWSVVDRVDDIVLCVSELATNAVLHAEEGAYFRIAAARLRSRIRIAVLDTSQRPPQIKHPKAGEDSGRGLQLVEELADRHGTCIGFLGKAVWCEFDLSGAAGGPR